MRNIYTYILIFMSAVSSCGAFAQSERPVAGTVRIEPLAFAEVGDSLKIEFYIHVSRKAMNFRQSWTIATQLVRGDSIMTMPYALINGKQKARHYRRQTIFENYELFNNPPYLLTEVSPETDTVIRYSISCPYELWMDTAALEVKQELLSSAGKRQQFYAGGFGMVKLEPREAYAVQPLVNYLVPEREDKQRRMQGQAFLDFQIGRSVILPDYRRNPEELGKIAEAVSKIKNDPDVDITGIFIEGYASPDGKYSTNERLSRERSEALQDYMSRNLGIGAEMFRVSSVAEDWDGLRSLIETSNIPQKEKVYAIIDSDDDYDRKESRLRVLGGPWRTITNEIFPALRRVEYQIDFSVKDYTVEESRDLAEHNPELLSQRELFILAQSYPVGSSQRDEILDMIFRLYPDDITAIVNSAAAMLERGEDATAKRYLDRIEVDPRAWNDLGVYWLCAGDLDQAERYLRMASESGVPQAEHNLIELETKREDNKIMERYNR